MDLRVSAPHSTPAAALAGRLLDGRYQVEATLARGGMATVYRALDIRLDRVVALKVMHPELAADEDFVARFITEARSAARLSHPAVVAVYDQGEDGGTVYLAMEYVQGRTLRQVLRDQGQLASAPALDVLDPVLAALHAAHAAGIVHRDVKPENVLVADDGRVKVADFGLARALTDASSTTRGLLLGTVNYISPEQSLGEPATPRSDVYSAGVMLYELVTGRPPHTGPTDFVVVRRHIEEDVPAPSRAEPTVPARLDLLVQRATHRDPQRRFADAGQFLEALRHTREDLDPAAPALEPRESAGVSVAEALTSVLDAPPELGERPELSPQPATPRTTSVRPAQPTRRRQARRRQWRGPIVFMLVLVLAAGVAAGAWWYGAGRYTVTPSLIDLTVDEATAVAAEDGLTVVEAGSRFSEVVEAGRVVDTEPGPGERVLHAGTIEIYTSRGPERYEVPNLVGLTRADAEKALAAVGIPLGSVGEEFHDTVPEAVVISQSEPPGEQLRRDTAVSIVVSKGREPIEIEDFTGRPFAEAEQALSAAGFEVVAEEKSDSSAPFGTVISQDPASGTGFRGDKIHLQVSADRKLRIPVPDVVGMDVTAARLLLSAVGFEVEVENPGGGRKVTAQSPRAGQLRELGSRVRLQVGRS